MIVNDPVDCLTSGRDFHPRSIVEDWIMTRWPKPAEGSWTEHDPELGTGLVTWHLHKTAAEWVEEYRRGRVGA
jgi:hypothetical protein